MKRFAPSSLRALLCSRAALLLALIGSLSVAACSDDSGGTDAGPGDSAITEAGTKLWSCDNPGQACNAHDTCAIDPICGQDKLCRPTNRQNCDDGLPCTKDDCGGGGLCKNEPVKDACALLVKGPQGSEEQCFKKGDVSPDDPCKGCNPSDNKRKWTARNGGVCDDGNPCTKDDYCQGGSCEGVYFGNACSDQLDCTDDICDGKGGCKNKLKSDVCLVKAACKKDKEASADGCAICDPQKDQFAWTPLTALCKIGSRCYAAGTFDATGCGVCDPQNNKNGWSAAPGTCLIGSQCLKKGDKDPTGCGECDPQKNATAYSTLAGKCLIAGVCYSQGDKSASGCASCDSAAPTAWTPIGAASAQTATFEGGLDGYVLSAASGGVGWQVDAAQAHGGSKSLYYGNPTQKSYDSGAANSGTATSASITLPAAQKAELSFWLYLDTEASTGFDVLSVKVGSTALWVKGPKTMPQGNYRRWVPVSVDLSAYAGQSINVIFSFETLDAWSNSGQGVFVDDITVLTSCGS